MNFVRRRICQLLKVLLGVADQPDFADIKELASETVQMYIDEEIDELYILYNHYVSAISQAGYDTKLLPITDIAEHRKYNK